MIAGVVSGERELLIDIEVITAGQSLAVRAVVDTGFNGYLTLTREMLTAAVATSAGTRRAELGDGQIVDLELFLIRIKWLGEEHDILAVQSDAAPLLGMSLLWGKRVAFDAQDGGAVIIDPLP